MRHRGIAAALAMAAMGIGAPLVATTASAEKAIAPAPAQKASRKKNRILRTPSGGYFKPVRSRGAAPKRKLKGNRNTISKRVRRKHRRAA